MDEPIEVSRSALLGQLTGLARAALLWGGGWLAAKGIIPDAVVAAAVPVIMTAGALMWQQARIFRLHAERVTMATALPDAVAVVK